MWLLLAFLSAALLGFYDVFKKKSLTGNALVPVLALNTVFCSLIFLPLIAGSAAGLIPSASTAYIPVCGWETHRYILLKSVIVLSSWALGYAGIKHLPLTIVGPVNATRPVMVLVGALFVFGERLNAWQWAGVALAAVSFFLLSRSGKREGVNFAHNKWIACVVVAALLGATSALYDKYLMAPTAAGGAGLDKLAVQGWYNIYQMGMMGIVVLTVWYPRRRKGDHFRWSWAIPCISLFLSAADFLYFYALSVPGAMISIVSMVRRSSVIVSFAFGALVLRENNLRSKAVDLALVLLGMICLAIGAL
jgi:bacterial/archaeal transporter family protein